MENIREIAKDLNIGLQHIIFIDDSEFEIEMVNELLPDVTTILVPKDLSKLKYIFDGKGYFDNLQSTDLDSNRTEMYLSEKLRKKELNSVTNIKDYYASLGIVASVSKTDNSDLARVAQLTQKTNQFNLTTIRYNESEINALKQSDDSDIIVLKAEDKFGAYGLIGVAIVKYRDEISVIDTFLMSCRAIGRGLEEVLFNECIRHAKLNSTRSIDGLFVKTEKNMQVENFYDKHGFNIKNQDCSKTIYSCDLDAVKTSIPEHIDVR